MDDLGCLPRELILYIADLGTKADAACLCLTNKKYYHLLRAAALEPLKVDDTALSNVLKRLERDLPWDRYQCALYPKLHTYRYERSACTTSYHTVVSPHRWGSWLQWENIQVVKRKYLAGVQQNHNLKLPVSISYHYEEDRFEAWAHIDLRPGHDGKLYLRCQTWLRWTKPIWEIVEYSEVKPAARYFCGHDGSRSGDIMTFGPVWRSKWIRLNDTKCCKDLTEDEMSQQAPTNHPPKQLFADLPKIWFRYPLYACKHCQTDYSVTYGFLRCQNTSNLMSYPISHEDAFPAKTRLSVWGAKVRNLVPRTSKPYYWSDSMVITKWMCIEAAEGDDDVAGVRYNWDRYNPEHQNLYGEASDYEVSAMKTAFDRAGGNHC